MNCRFPVRLAIATFGVLSTGSALASEAASEMPPVRRAEIRYTCTIDKLPADAKIVDLWIPVPTSDERQTVRLLNENELSGGRFTTDKRFGNRMYYRQYDLATAGREPIKVELRYDVEVREYKVEAAKQLAASRQETPPAEFAVYLGENRMIPIRGRITALAGDIDWPQGQPLRAGRKVYDYLIDTMVYNYKAPGAGKGDAVWACDSKTGDCTDYNSVFIGLCRLKGIPADHVFGMPMPPGKQEGDMRYCHCWARYWVADVGWIPLDPSRADKYPDDREYYFGTLGSTWLTIAHGRDVVLEPPQKGPPLNMFHDPAAEADGRPLEAVKWLAHYKEQPNSTAAE